MKTSLRLPVFLFLLVFSAGSFSVFVSSNKTAGAGIDAVMNRLERRNCILSARIGYLEKIRLRLISDGEADQARKAEVKIGEVRTEMAVNAFRRKRLLSRRNLLCTEYMRRNRENFLRGTAVVFFCSAGLSAAVFGASCIACRRKKS